MVYHISVSSSTTEHSILGQTQCPLTITMNYYFLLSFSQNQETIFLARYVFTSMSLTSAPLLYNAKSASTQISIGCKLTGFTFVIFKRHFQYNHFWVASRDLINNSQIFHDKLCEYMNFQCCNISLLILGTMPLTYNRHMKLPSVITWNRHNGYIRVGDNPSSNLCQLLRAWFKLYNAFVSW